MMKTKTEKKTVIMRTMMKRKAKSNKKRRLKKKTRMTMKKTKAERAMTMTFVWDSTIKIRTHDTQRDTKKKRRHNEFDSIHHSFDTDHETTETTTKFKKAKTNTTQRKALRQISSKTNEKRNQIRKNEIAYIEHLLQISTVLCSLFKSLSSCWCGLWCAWMRGYFLWCSAWRWCLCFSHLFFLFLFLFLFLSFFLGSFRLFFLFLMKSALFILSRFFPFCD